MTILTNGVVGMTIFADLTNEEYKRTYLGTRITKTPGVFTNEKAVAAPASVDWRTSNAVTPIKNQGQCMPMFPFTTLIFFYTVSS
jgi:hypothetical protein